MKQTASNFFFSCLNEENLQRLYHERIAVSAAVGKDGVRRGSFEDTLIREIRVIVRKIESGTYAFTTYKQKLIARGAARNPREISIPTFRDRLVLRLVCDTLAVAFPDARSRPPHEHIKAIHERLRTLDPQKEFVFVRVDVRNFYPSILHSELLKKLKAKIRKEEVLTLIQNAISTPTGSSRGLRPEIGVPQGLSISNILAGIYMQSIDKKMSSKAEYFRFVDDILILCEAHDAKKTLRSVTVALKSIGLDCHELGGQVLGKTMISSVADGVEYLGYKVSLSSLSVRRSSYERMFSNITKVFTGYKYSKNKERFLWRLNLKVSGCRFDSKRLGWVYFFSQTTDRSQLMRLDAFVDKMLRKHNLMDLKERVKKFINTYYEIRHNERDTLYIPDFEVFPLDDKVQTISLLTGKSVSEIRTWPIDLIESTFRKCTWKEVAQLEKDVMEVHS